MNAKRMFLLLVVIVLMTLVPFAHAQEGPNDPCAAGAPGYDVNGVHVDCNPEAQAQRQVAGSIWSNWRNAGYRDGCLNNDAITTEFVQEMTGLHVARLSTQAGAHIYAGDEPVDVVMPDTVMISDEEELPGDSWWLLDLVSGEMTQGPGSVTTTQFVLFNSTCYENGLDEDSVQSIVDILLSDDGCDFEPGFNETVMEESLSIPGDQFGPVDVVTIDEHCGFAYGPGHVRMIIPENVLATIHPFDLDGDGPIGDPEDKPYMWVGDGTTVHDVYRGTFRRLPGYPEDDVINIDLCEVWWKEEANAKLDVNPFGISRGNLSWCLYDVERIEFYMRLSDPTAELADNQQQVDPLSTINSLLELQELYEQERAQDAEGSASSASPFLGV